MAGVAVADRVPDTRKPVGNECKHENEQDQHSSTILYVMVQFTGHAAQAEQAHHFESTEEATDTLEKKTQVPGFSGMASI